MSDPTKETGLGESAMMSRLRCPETGDMLQRDGAFLRTEDSAHRYRVNALGVPLFAESILSSDAERQREHCLTSAPMGQIRLLA